MEFPDYSQFEKQIDVIFTDKDLLRQAFVHRSFINEKAGRGLKHNERLEFLGDAVLELAVTDFLYSKFSGEPEGVLTAYRAAMVNTVSLSRAARKLELEAFLLLSKGERMDTNKGREHILANTFEALVGALYMDGGFAVAQKFISESLFDYIDEILEQKLYKDAKSYFQEIAQEKQKITPHYELVDAIGPDHDKEFIMGVFLAENKIAEGKGYSKQKAESEAARAGLEKMGWL